MRKALIYITLSMLFLACNTNEQKIKKVDIGQDSLLQESLDNQQLVNNELSVLKDSMANSKLNKNKILANYNKEHRLRLELEQTIINQSIKIDSIKNIVAKQETTIDRILAANKKNTTNNPEIESLIIELHTAIFQLSENKDIDSVIQFFLPRFSIKHVTIDKENKGHIVDYNHDDFHKHLKDLTKNKDKRTMEELRILDIEIKDATFYNIMYRFNIQNNNTNISYLMSTITAKKTDNGEIQIANLSLVEFQL